MDHEYYTALASGQHEIFQQLYPSRGNIYVQEKQGALVKGGNGEYPLAINKNMHLVYAVPKDIEDSERALGVLVETFGLDLSDDNSNILIDANDTNIREDREDKEDSLEIVEEELSEEEQKQIDDQELYQTWKERLNKTDDPYEPLQHLATDEQIEMLEEFDLPGIHWTKEVSRYYPEKETGSQMVGFVGKQAENNMLKGYYGVEGCYNKILGGDAGFLRSELDTFGRWIATAGKDFRKADDGHDLVLTIDKSIQYYACQQLNEFIERFEADKGSVVVMDPKTGAVIAMCNAPSFDPNKYNEIEELSVFNNGILIDNYEPGSVFKPITMAAALDSGKVDPFTGYNDSGELRISKFPIRNSDGKAHGWQTMTQVLEKSLNTGAVFAARQVGLDDFKRYVEGFGFGQKTEVDLCTEQAGNINSLNDRNEIYLATASFGQGITVTPMQLVRAFGAIANEGKLVEPYIVQTIRNKRGEIVEDRQTKITGQVISPQTSKLLGSMLVSVVKSGHAGKAAVDGYLVAGKTGTAQVPDREKGGYSDDTIHTFVGFAPFNQPRFVMVTKLDHVKAVKYSSDSAAPLFGKIAKFILDYYEVSPEVK
jgi:cell division protein FtsI/penicillin-binding protein 2